MAAIPPDTKDWTWVLDRPCPQCGFEAANYPHAQVGAAIRSNAATWPAVLDRTDAARRTRPDKWSVLEYGCHVRDVLRIFDDRLARMLTEDDPAFENWDQDATARRDGYELQDPGVVATQLGVAADVLAGCYDTITGPQWQRTGTRSDGARFTVATLAVYGLHDPIHHLWDVMTT